jgi:hypothetical protein
MSISGPKGIAAAARGGRDPASGRVGGCEGKEKKENGGGKGKS